MKNGLCPQCNATTVYSKPYGASFSIDQDLFISTSIVNKGVPFVSYLCTTCGYFENYVNDQKKLADVTKTWDKVA